MDESTVEMRRLIGKVSERHGIHIDLSDPAFYVLSLNEFALEESTRTIVEQIRRAAGDLEASAERVQQRVGVFVAEQIKDACAALGHESVQPDGRLRSRCDL